MNNNFKITNDEIILNLEKDTPADPTRDWLRALHFEILLKKTEEKIGEVDFRIGYTTSVVLYGGHIGYGILEEFRGNHYAGKACLLLKNEIKKYGFDVIWITCNPENIASRKTCEYIGAKFIEIVDLPIENDQYLEGQKKMSIPLDFLLIRRITSDN